jgi:hypothetical protein
MLVKDQKVRETCEVSRLQGSLVDDRRLGSNCGDRISRSRREILFFVDLDQCNAVRQQRTLVPK